MNFADIETMWRSPHNRPDAAILEKQKMQFIADLRRRRRGNLFLLAITFVPLAWLTYLIVSHVLAPAPGTTPVDLSREWGIIPFFALPWIGWLFLVRLVRRHHTRHADYAQSIQASVTALLDENRSERRRHKVIAALLILSALVLPLIVQQLRAVGKAGDEILFPAYVIYPAYVVFVLTWSGWRYRRKLIPRQRELESLRAAYERDEAAV